MRHTISRIPSRFNPRPPHGRRLSVPTTRLFSVRFNPRPPHGRRRCRPFPQVPCPPVSIHAPLTGGDLQRLSDLLDILGFNPRPPHGRRLAEQESLEWGWVFQSTPPSREATGLFCHQRGLVTFQSTPPSREATPHPTDRRTMGAVTFQSTPPSREATAMRGGGAMPIPVSIHAPLTGGDPLLDLPPIP